MAHARSELKQEFPVMATATLLIARGLAAAVLLIFACAGPLRADPLASACTKTYAPQTLDVTQPVNLGQLKLQLYFYACSGAYDSDMHRVLADARTYMEKRATEVSKPALVLDIDETSLSNLPEILANDFGFIEHGTCDNPPKPPCGWDAWTSKPYAKAIDATLALFNAAKANNVAVFFITGRKLTDTADKHNDAAYKTTAENLIKAGYSGWTDLVLRQPSTSNKSVADYKSGERAKIAGRFTIIANVGDQRSDLDGGYAERAYKLPNPFYYIP